MTGKNRKFDPSKYRECELAYFEDVYGVRNEHICGFDPNWDRRVRNVVKKSGEPSFLETHVAQQIQREEAAQTHWEVFLATESGEALRRYVQDGGEINQVVRTVIVGAIEDHASDKKNERYETVLAVREILKEHNFKIKQTNACEILAKRKALAQPNKTEDDLSETSEVDSAVRNFNRHIKQFELETGFSIDDPIS